MSDITETIREFTLPAGQHHIRLKHPGATVLFFPKPKFDRMSLLEMQHKELRSPKLKSFKMLIEEDKSNYYIVLKKRLYG